jgi:hypothetical protein
MFFSYFPSLLGFVELASIKVIFPIITNIETQYFDVWH